MSASDYTLDALADHRALARRVLELRTQVVEARAAVDVAVAAEREKVLGEAILAIHIRRFEHVHGKVGGPDSYYAGVQAARHALYHLLPEGAADPLAPGFPSAPSLLTDGTE